MSQVPAYRRRESGIQYIDTARELVVHTIGYARKFPKSMMFLLTKDIVDTAKSIYTNVVIANSCKPTSADAVKFRRAHFDEARGQIDALDGLLSIALEMYSEKLLEKSVKTTDKDGNERVKKQGISDYGWVHWGELLEKEKKLIKGILAVDAKNIQGGVL